MAQTAVVPGQIVGVAARSLLGNNTAAADAAQTISFSAASAGQVLTVQGDGSVAFATVSAGIGGSTGSTDNAVLRADGTGGATLQSSGWIVPDIFTASPNATVNHLSLQASGSSTNVSVSIVPKGTGAFTLQVPDGTTTGGNARGANSVDLQRARTNANQVVEATHSLLVATVNSRISTGVGTGVSAIIAANDCNITAGNAHAVIACSELTLAGSQSNAAIGCFRGSSDTVNHAVMLASQNAKLTRSCMIAHASGRWSADGDRQSFQLTGGVKTTTDAGVEMNFGLGVGNAPIYITVAAGFVISGTLLIQGWKSDGSVAARYCRQFTIRRVGNTTTLDNVETVGVDLVNGTSLNITADDTNERLKIEPVGVLNETWRWQCDAQCIEQTFGS